MKLKERLAVGYAMVHFPDDMNNDRFEAQNAFLAGFEKCRELTLALDTDAANWFEVPIEEIKNLGEEEVE